ncbi:MAG TPA: hypothetical protein VK854_04065 [Woeseiaceae bacterium]|nr:hypothetical protein [Woeseiaceae bacterium]
MGRLLAEAMLIVFSILLAFGIEAWWAGRGERAAEAEAMAGLRSDFSENVRRLQEARASHAGIRASALRLLAMTGPAAVQTAPELVMDTLVMDLISGPKVYPVSGTHDALIASGRIGILESAELRRELATWSATIANLQEAEREGFVQMDQRLLPFLWDYVPVVTLDLNVLPRYKDVPIARSRFTRRYSDLLRSRRFENAVEERMNSSINTLERFDEAEASAFRVLELLDLEPTAR